MRNKTGSNRPFSLSRKTAGSISWQDISSVLESQGLDTHRGSEGREVQETYPPDYDEKVIKIFEAPKREFAAKAAVLKRQLQLALWIVFPALGIAIAVGALLAIKTPVGGGLLSTGGLAALFGLLGRTWRLGRDQVILELFPTRYEMLLRLCKTPQQYELVLQALFAEMVEMRRNLE